MNTIHIKIACGNSPNRSLAQKQYTTQRFILFCVCVCLYVCMCVYVCVCCVCFFSLYSWPLLRNDWPENISQQNELFNSKRWEQLLYNKGKPLRWVNTGSGKMILLFSTVHQKLDQNNSKETITESLSWVNRKIRFVSQ